MPEMTGLELLKEVRQGETLKTLPVLMVTAEPKREQIIEAVKFKVNGYVVKPFNATTLASKIDAIFPKKKIIRACKENSVSLAIA